jgi:hypothetical protein
MRTPLGPSRTSKSLHRTVPTSDVPLSLPGTPESVSLPPDALTRIPFLAERDLDVDLEAEGLRFVPPVRAERARARERLPSYREPPSRNPRPGLHAFLIGGAWSPRTVSPSLHPCPASGGASGFLPASALVRHEVSRPPGGKDARCVRSMSATRTTCVNPHLARSRLTLATFAAWTFRGV